MWLEGALIDLFYDAEFHAPLKLKIQIKQLIETKHQNNTPGEIKEINVRV